MDDVVGLELRVEPAEGGGVPQIGLHEAEILGVFQLRQPRPLQLDGVVVVKVVHAQHRAPPRSREPAAGVVTDEPGGAGDEDLHGGVDRGAPDRLLAKRCAWGGADAPRADASGQPCA
jgi:hypothetical protein